MHTPEWKPWWIPAVVLLAACTGPEETLEDLTLLSGVWYGTQTIYQTGGCSIGGEDQISSDVVYSITVHNDGVMDIRDSASTDLIFLGEVSADLELSFRSHYSVQCSEEIHYDSSTYEGHVEIHTDYYEIDMSAHEMWCPPECTFDVVYHLRKNL